MRLYLDTSVLVKLYVDEEGAQAVRQAVGRAELIVTSAIAYVEARAAFARRRHEQGVAAGEHARIRRDLDADWPRYLAVEVTAPIIREAARLAEAHRLRAYDAVHVASATATRGQLEGPLAFGCWDAALERAAQREGLQPLPR